MAKKATDKKKLKNKNLSAKKNAVNKKMKSSIKKNLDEEVDSSKEDSMITDGLPFKYDPDEIIIMPLSKKEVKASDLPLHVLINLKTNKNG